MNEFQTIFTPTKTHISQIETWLKKEQNQGNNNFYGNWKTILIAQENKTLAVCIYNSFPIGFIAYRVSDGVMDIDIAVISLEYRNKGIGKLFIDEVLNKNKEDGILVCQLFCEPKSSEIIWRSLSFQKFPESLCKENIWMYKPLISIMVSSAPGIYFEKIELWDSEPHIARMTIPKWTWSLDISNSSKDFSKPIIFPTHHDWQVKWTKNKEIMFEGKIKRFKYNLFDSNDYLIFSDY